jgi:hypothetical protein
MYRIIYFAVLLAVILSLALPLVAVAEGSEVDTATVPSPYPYLRHSFYAEGLEWVFYVKNTAAYFYKTGSVVGNVTTWSSPTALTGESYQDLYFDGTYCYGVGATTGTGANAIMFRRGQPLGNGSIDWDDPVMAVGAYGHYVSASVCVDSQGYPYISAYWNNAPTYWYSGIQFMYGSANDGTYGTNTIKYPGPGTPNYTGEVGHHVVPMADDEILLVWSYALCGLNANVWNGSTLENVVTSPVDIAWPNALSVVSNGTDATVVFLSATNDPNNEIDYDSFNMSTNAWAGAITIPMTVSHYGFPVLTKSSTDSSMYLAWQSTNSYYGSSGDSILFRVYSEGIWGGNQIAVLDADLHDDLYLWNLFADYSTPTLNYGVYWFDVSHSLKFSDELASSGAPYGVALAVSNKTATSATINGKCISDGNLTTSATFYWAGTGIYTANTISIGTVVGNETFSRDITGLSPNGVYWYWVSFVNSSGSYLTSTVNFQTLATSGPEAPIVQTLAATNVGDTSGEINGYLAHDGNLPCYLAFRWRQQGDTNWTESWYGYCGSLCSLPTYRSPLSYSGTLRNLETDTVYEYQAMAKNGVATTGVYGSTVTFTTAHAGGPTPPPTGGVGITLPPGITDFFRNLSSSTKLILAIIVNVFAVITVVWFLRLSKGVGIAALVTGLGLVILFTVIGWYPMWIIMLIGAIVGLLVFLLLLGKR